MATLVVQLLRARDDVFYDVDSIPAGERWRDVLGRAIENASHFYLLWCIHSAGSLEVKSEYERAISANTRLVPVLLDSTPLIKPLTEYQWVDFRGLVQGHQDGELAEPAARAARAKWPFAVALLTIIVIVASLLIFPLASDPSIVPSVRPGVWLALTVVAGVALVTLIARRYKPRRGARRAAEQVADGIARDLATYGGGSGAGSQRPKSP